MKLSTKLSALAFLLFVIGTSSVASAQVTSRCAEDPLGTTDAMGRNAWAANCGYITPAARDFFNTDGEYIVFTTGCGHAGCAPFVPVTATAGCIFGLVKLEYCMAGCYTPEQKVAFNGAYKGVQNAYETGTTSVTALTQGSSLNNLGWAEQAIRTYVAGETTEDIFVLKDKKGDVLQVTSEHPLVLEDGTVVKARTLKKGDRIVKANGKSVKLTSVSTFSFTGTVWNVQPASHDKTENILAAQGFLTGSVRFQNEWADDVFRLSLRDELDVGNL
jgi:hypothetical protein